MKTILLGAIWISVPPAILFAIHGSFLTSIVLYFVVPSMYLAITKREVLLHALAAAMCSVPCVTFFDYLAYINRAWSVQTVFDWRLFNMIPIEDYLFTAFACFAAVAAYRVFQALAKVTPVNINAVMRFFLAACVASCALVLLSEVAPGFVRIRFYYAWLDLTVFVVPVAAFLLRNPSFFNRFVRAAPFVFVLMFVYEITALKLGMWSFPSTDYIFSWNLLGVRFPIEEMLAWMVLFFPISIAFSEVIVSA